EVSKLAAYSRYEAGLRAIASSDVALASAVAHLESSPIAGALASPLTTIRLDIWGADWREAGAPLAALLPLLGIDVPLSADKPAWGPFAGIVLAGRGMLATDWDVVADTMTHLAASKAEALFTSLMPFILQSHGRLLVFALPEPMMANAVFANHLQQALRADSRGRRKQSQSRHRIARVYHNCGAGYTEDESIVVRPTTNHDGGVAFSWQAPPAVESVRFDPVEGSGVVCRGVAATVDGTAVDIVPVNCQRFGAALDVFMTTDSIYDLRGVTPEAAVVVTMDAIDYIDASDFLPRLPEDEDLLSYGGPLTATLAAIQAELTAMREAHDAVREAHDAMLEVRLRRRLHVLIARVRALLATARRHASSR
ncbi:MAG: hypothetical protein ACRELG_25620, partial [Gemmataceae bacterium]